MSTIDIDPQAAPPAPPAAPTPSPPRRRGLGGALADRLALRSAIGLGPIAVLFGLNLVDELDRVAFAAVLPEIRNTFGLTDEEALTIAAIVSLTQLMASLPLGVLADRRSRVRISLGAAVLWGVCSVLTGLVPFVALLVLVRIGGAIGRIINEVVHPSLIADYYEREDHPKVFGAHRLANSIGALIGPIGGVIAAVLFWQAGFFILAVPTALLILVAATRLKEPVRGSTGATGVVQDVADALTGHGSDAAADGGAPPPEEPTIGFFEARRRLFAIPTLKRFYVGGVLLGMGALQTQSILSLYFERVHDYGPAGRSLVQFALGIGTVLGIVLGARLADRATKADRTPQLARIVGFAFVLQAAALGLLGLPTPSAVALAFVLALAIGSGAYQPAYFAIVGAVAPPRIRSQAYAWNIVCVGLGGLFYLGIADVGQNSGYRTFVVVLGAIIGVAGLVGVSASKFVADDLAHAEEQVRLATGALPDGQLPDDVAGIALGGATVPVSAHLSPERPLDDTEVPTAMRTSTRPRSAANGAATTAGRSLLDTTGPGGENILVCEAVEVSYGQVQILFGVDVHIGRGEIVALLGTNGAGKSTLLKAISGLVRPKAGRVMFDGRDITGADPVACAKAGIVQVPGGKACFPTLTVAEHFRAGTWLYQKDDPKALQQRIDTVLELFPRVRERWDQQAGNLSGGEQQQLALGMAFVAQPKLLIIDELSLGLAPTIVEQLLGIVREIHASGTSIVLVEQSVNVALSIADRAYFLEKGEVRFDGPTAELLERGDILRSVFLEGAAKGTGTAAAAAMGPRPVDKTKEPVLSVRDLSVRFGGIRAVNDVSFDLYPGQILGLIGANGAGKTTIFDMISGLLEPSAGRVLLQGNDVTGWGPDRRAATGLGRSFQDAKIFPSLTVAENVAIGLERHIECRDHLAALLSLPAALESETDVSWTVEDLIELMGLQAFRDKFVSELSTGTRRIVDLAMSIAHDPTVLLLDEPSSGVAQKETEALGPLLRRIQSETGCAMLLIEHDMPLMTTTSDELICLELGEIIAQGHPQDVISNPRVVSSYLGGDVNVINRSGAQDAPADDGPAVTDGIEDDAPRRPRRAPRTTREGRREPLKARGGSR